MRFSPVRGADTLVSMLSFCVKLLTSARCSPSGIAAIALEKAVHAGADEACIMFEGKELCGRMHPDPEMDGCILSSAEGWVCA